MLGGLNPVKWIDDLLPEMLWLGMLNNDHGHRRGVQLAEALATAADRAMAPHTKVFAVASEYSSIASDRWADIIRLISTDSANVGTYGLSRRPTTLSTKWSMDFWRDKRRWPRIWLPARLCGRRISHLSSYAQWSTSGSRSGGS